MAWEPKRTTEEGGVSESKFNSALASLERLHKWLITAGQYSFVNDGIGWKNALDNVFKEIIPKLTPEEEEDLNKLRIEIKKEMTRIMEESTQKNMDARFIPTNLHNLLEPFEIKMRKYADKHGLLIPGKKTVFDFM